MFEVRAGIGIGAGGGVIRDLVKQQLEKSAAVMRAVLGDASIHDAVAEAGRVTAEALRAGCKLMACGNGGSAADAQHLVAEFVVRLEQNRPALRAIALTTDSSILTAAGNDYGYEHVFERQVEALGQKGDVLLAISTSGNSKNCVLALKKARALGVHTVSFTGSGGGAMKELSEIHVAVPSTVTMNIQECHLALEHIFCMVVECCYFGPGFGSEAK